MENIKHLVKRASSGTKFTHPYHQRFSVHKVEVPVFNSNPAAYRRLSDDIKVLEKKVNILMKEYEEELKFREKMKGIFGGVKNG